MGIFDCPPIELCIADNNLERIFSHNALVHVQPHAKAGKSQSQPCTHYEIAQDTQALDRLLFDRVGDGRIKADAGHEQEIARVDLAKVDAARSAMQ
jgi:hypothetical protein